MLGSDVHHITLDFAKGSAQPENKINLMLLGCFQIVPCVKEITFLTF